VSPADLDRFHHEALLYTGREGFLAGTVPFVQDAVAAGEPVLVVVDSPKIDALRGALNGESRHVEFADMGELGRNPACIIPAWQDFLDRHATPGRRLRGIGEPISAARSRAELVECHRHEALLNLAFEGGPSWWLLCPYDVDELEPDVVELARRSHPWIREDGRQWSSGHYAGDELADETLVDPLSPPTCDVRQRSFDVRSLRAVREMVREHAEAVLGPERTADLVLAVSEVAANSVIHGGGVGVARVWHDRGRIVCEVSDIGRLDDALAGRRRPRPAQPDGRGLFIVNQVCDLVQVRSFPGGSTVRLHMTRG
jgi:anti-sigma regulatory factor (Ser/Thr protein kinase)